MSLQNIQVGISCFMLVAMISFNGLYAQDGLPPGVTADDLTNDIITAVEDMGGPANPTNTNTNTATNTTNNVGNTNDGGTGAGPDVDLGPMVEFNDTMIAIEADMRTRRGFVGASIMDPDEVLAPFRFVGPRNEMETVGARDRLGSADNNSNTNASNNAENGTTIQRGVTPIRTRLVRGFRAPTVAPNFVGTRVNTRLSQLPATERFSNSMNVSMRGRTAVITGTAHSQSQVDRIRRQLRLEPGVSRIESQVTVLSR